MTTPDPAQVNDLRLAVETMIRVFKIDEHELPGGRAKLGPADAQAIIFVSRRPACIASELAEFLDVVPTTASAVIDRLVKRGLLTRSRTEENRRIVQLELTPAGHEAMRALTAEMNTKVGRMLEQLHPEQRHSFVSSMQRIATGLVD